MIVLGIETSCDETAVSICENGKILSNVVSSQLVHSEFGGVIPEVASREHERMLNNITIKAIKDASITKEKIQGIAVTNGPGLAGSLLTGVSFAKGLALGLDVDIVSVNHLEAHVMVNLLDSPNINFPFICLLVSGGHTQLWQINELDNYILLGETRDDAAGEAFDKGARIMGLGYPGGPAIEKCAENGNPKLIDFPRPLIKNNKIEFSFSGLKTSLLYFMDNFDEAKKFRISDVSASYQKAIVDCLINKLELAVSKTNVNTIAIAGGVAKNSMLRKQLKKVFPENKVIFPDLNLCTDNAAMISFLGEKKFNLGYKSDLGFKIYPNFLL